MKITSTPAFGNKPISRPPAGSIETAKEKLAELGVPAESADRYLKRVAPENGIKLTHQGKIFHTPQSKLLFDICDALTIDGARIAKNIMKHF